MLKRQDDRGTCCQRLHQAPVDQWSEGMPPERLAASVMEEIKILRGRGMAVEEEKARHHLETVSYYRLLSYVTPFADTKSEDERNLAGSSFDRVISLYTFDRKLRLLVLDAIERIEVALRAQWIKNITLNYGERGYLDKSNYLSIENFFRDIKNLGSQYWIHKGDEIENFRHGDSSLFPPVHIASEVMSFGTLSKLINNLKTDTAKQQISNYFEFDSSIAFSSALRHITYIRNISAHHGRLWNRYIVVKLTVPGRPCSLASSMYLEKHEKQSKHLYNTLVLLCHMLRIIAPEAEWKNRMIEFLGTCPLSITEHMGFPEDWKGRSVWKANE